MASRSKRTGSVASTSTPLIDVRPTSPTSPQRNNRLQEKAELQNLNDRLATYIDTVRFLESENSRLTMEVQTSRESVTREVSNIKTMYEHELSDARKLLDETSNEKAKLEIQTKRLWEELEDLRARYDTATKALSIAEGSSRMYESRCTDLGGKLNSAAADRNKALADLKNLEKENEKLKSLLAECRRNLEEETLSRVGIENAVQSLKEELAFKDQVHEKMMTETRTRRQVDISEIDGRLADQYEAKMQEALKELRLQYEAQMRANRDEIEMLYENKIKALENSTLRNNKTTSAVMDELRMSRSRSETLNAKIHELENTISALNMRNRELEKLMEEERLRHANELAAVESELMRLREEMVQQLQEYQDLMDIKVSLDLEIAAYDKLLKGEEHRLNITPVNAASVSSLSHSMRSSRGSTTRATPVSAAKRKRTIVEEDEERSLSDFSVTSSAKGDVEILETDGEGKFVRLHNKSNKEVAIGAWQLVRTVGANETLFKFHRSVKIDAGAHVTVWSADAGASHEPPTNIVMKQKWIAGDNIKTQLLNVEGDEVAASERVRNLSSSHASRHREFSALRGEHLFHHQVRSSSSASARTSHSGAPDEKCHIM